jgi:hypothetical protein
MMNTGWPILGLIACPLGMLAIGGVAWAAGKLGRGRWSSNPFASLRRKGETAS